MESAFLPWKKYLVYFVLSIIALFLYSWITSPMVVTVTGTGEMEAQVESVALTFSITSNTDNPESSLSNVKSIAQNIKNKLSEMGIPESSVYESQAVVVPASALTQGATGFQSTLSMGIKTENVSGLDRIISTLYQNGVLIVSQPILTAKDSEEMNKKAYDLALKNAKSKANKIALSNLKFLKKIVLIQESEAQNTSTVTTKADVATQVEENIAPTDGLIKINKTVSVSYKMW